MMFKAVCNRLYFNLTGSLVLGIAYPSLAEDPVPPPGCFITRDTSNGGPAIICPPSKNDGNNPNSTSSTPDPVATPTSSPSPSPAEGFKDPNLLKYRAIQAAKANPRDCADSVYVAAVSLGINGLPVPKTTNANDQITYMEKNWRRVTMQEAMELANQGYFVVAGATSNALNLPPKHPQANGHTAVIAPGSREVKGTGNKKMEWPYVIGGALSKQASSIESPYSNNGMIPIRRAFPVRKLEQSVSKIPTEFSPFDNVPVRFYTPYIQ